MAERLKLHIVKPGLFTTIQDAGRQGYMAQGIPMNGAMDKKAHQIANLLVDNPDHSPCLEITLIGPEIEFEGQGQIAITGADLSARINGQLVDLGTTLNITEGDRLIFGKCKQGCRAYLAVRGNWDIPLWLGSASASPADLYAYTPQSLIKAGATINVDYEGFTQKKVVQEKKKAEAVRIMPGPEYQQFSEIQQQFLGQEGFKIGLDANRMGYRLTTDLPDFKPGQEVISSGIIPGTIQVANSGQTIILMADAQTSGGYPRIANVLSDDLGILAQKKPGDVVKFRWI